MLEVYITPVMLSDSSGCSPEGRKWWQNILIGVGIIVGAAIIGAAIAVSFGAATPFLTIVGTSIVGGLKIAAVAGATAGVIRAGTTAFNGGSLGDVGKSFVTGFADGFYAGSIYAGANMILSPIAMGISGAFNNGYGWGAGKWIGGYQTPSTPGISILTFLGGINGGRTFGLDMDMYNGLHFHTNKFGVGRKSKWIKAHHWYLAPIMIGIGVGFSDPWSIW